MTVQPENTPTGARPAGEVHGFDLHRAYRAMIREMLRGRWPQPITSPVNKEEHRG